MNISKLIIDLFEILDEFNSTGVTKVTVVVRQFKECHINKELLYETDSLNQGRFFPPIPTLNRSIRLIRAFCSLYLSLVSPSITFSDGSVSNHDNLVYIKPSSQGMVATIYLEHIGARIYISQFSHTKFLNIVIKFRTSTSNRMRQDLILNAINPISLCKSGCLKSELIDVEGELERANIEKNRKNNPSQTQYRNFHSTENIDYSLYDSKSIDYENLESSSNYDDDYEDDEEEIIDIYSDRRKRSHQDQVDLKSRKNRERKRNNKKKSKATITTEKPSSNRRKHPKNRRNRLRSSIVEENSLKSASISLATKLRPINELIYQGCYDKLIGYHRITCLYDTMIKGIENIDPFIFASTFDEPRLMSFNIQSSSATEHQSSNDLNNSALVAKLSLYCSILSSIIGTMIVLFLF